MNNSETCGDCGTLLQGNFCHNCGQKDSNPFSLKALFSEFLDSFLSMDSKLVITLKNMIIKPGVLTTEYWDGKRSRYISPIEDVYSNEFYNVCFASIFPTISK